jgi:predicted nucleic acid-binding protein
MSKRKIVLDTNCLIASLSRNGQYYPVWKGLQTDLIEADHDDDKFVDCAFAANATFIVSDDKHYDILKEISFPQLLVLKLKEFLGLLQS